jgi:hypothetical protein
MRGYWRAYNEETRQDELVLVEVRWDGDGDADVRPYGDTDPYANWTVYRAELRDGRLIW